MKTLYIEPGSPWENAYLESFNGKLEDELLGRELFTSLTEAKVLIEQYRLQYNHERPHSALGYRTPAECAATCTLPNVASAPGGAAALDLSHVGENSNPLMHGLLVGARAAWARRVLRQVLGQLPAPLPVAERY